MNRLQACFCGFGIVLSIVDVSAALAQDPISQSTSELRAAALSSLSEGHYDAAVNAADAMIRQQDADSRALRLAADVYLRCGKVELATKLFDQFVEMEPQQMPQMWQRGIALYFAGEYEKAAKQFEEHRRVNPHDVENAAWHYLCVAKAENADAAKQKLLAAPDDPRPPMAEILQMLASGNETVVWDRVRSFAEGTQTRVEAAFYADLYLGLYADAHSRADEAKRAMERAAKDAPHHYMGDVARVYLEVLTKRGEVKPVDK